MFDGILKKGNFLYFTVLSNLFCVGVLGALVVRTFKDIKRDGKSGVSGVSPCVKGCCMLCILLTMSVYHFVLIPYALKMNPYQNLKFSDIVFHYVMPFAVLFDWILFDEKGGFRWFYPLLWATVPFVYVLFVFAQSRFEIADRVNGHMNKYIYIFLDVGVLGFVDVMVNIVCLAVAFLAVAYLICCVDRIKLEF